MLDSTKAFSGFAVNDTVAALEFYGKTLELAIEAEGESPMQMLTLKVADGASILIYPKSDHQPATYTVLNFPVDDLEATVDALTAKGVVFEQYTGQAATDEKGIAHGNGLGPDIAWFRDPAGNILSVMKL